MDNQENETFTPPEVTATLLPPNRDTWSGGLDDLKAALFSVLHEDAARDRWLSSLQSMPLADLAAELSEEGALRYRGLLWRAHEAIGAFVPGNVPNAHDATVAGEVWLELEAALGVKI